MSFLLLRCREVLLLLLAGPAATAVEPKTNTSSATVNGDLLSVTSWHARTLTNTSWNISTWKQNVGHLIAITWDEQATAEAWWTSAGNGSRADNPPSSPSSNSDYSPLLGSDESLGNACNFRADAFDCAENNAFNTKVKKAFVSVELDDERAWWYIASGGQERPNATSLTSREGQASVLLSEPGIYTACLLLVSAGDSGENGTCTSEECVDFTVYQPPYDFLEVESTNIGDIITVRFNLASRSAYPGDWGWVLGGVDPSLTVDDANSLSAASTLDVYDERCWFYFGRAVELHQTFLCTSQSDLLLESFQNTPTINAYQYGRFDMYLSASGDGSLWFGQQERYTYSMITNFYTCGITVLPLNSTNVTTTTDIVVTALPEQGETCGVGDGIELSIHSSEVSAEIQDVRAWTYFVGDVQTSSSNQTSLYIRLAYTGEYVVRVSLASGATLLTFNISVVAADPYAPTCEVTARPPSTSPKGSSVMVSFSARDFYGNRILDRWGSDAFEAWSYALPDNATPASVYDTGNGTFRAVSEPLDASGSALFFVERNSVGIPGSPFEVYVFGPSTCAVVSTVSECMPNLQRRVAQEWEANSPCSGLFDPPAHSNLACDSIPPESGLGTAMLCFAAFAGLYAGAFLLWIRRNRKTFIVKRSQPFACQLLLVGSILLNITAYLFVGLPSDPACLARPWMMHVGLTFTSGCLYMKTYRVHRIFNSASKLSRVSISDRQLVAWVLKLVAVDVMILLMWTIADRPRKVHKVLAIAGGIEVIYAECGGGFAGRAFAATLWVWKAGLNCFGAVIAAKTWHCEDGVGESQQICLSIYNTSLLGLVNLGIQVFVEGYSVIGEGASALTLIGGTMFTVSVLFAHKAYKLWRYGDLSPSATERRGSATTTTLQTYGRRGSAPNADHGGRLTRKASGGAATAEAGRRKSSTTLNLAFFFADKGKILPINEGQNAEGEEEDEESRTRSAITGSSFAKSRRFGAGEMYSSPLAKTCG